ncbi:MAG: GNAT family N-acetyltransferase [bacterium]|nr:GNAT family N-acetyltransferase [bacterium]
MNPYVLHPLILTHEDDLAPLLAASLAEGYTFLQRLWNDYHSGTARYDAPGAALLAAVTPAGDLTAVGGVHRDPYLDQPQIGRIQHVYVLPAARRHGVGRLLMAGLIDHARPQFALLTLRTPTAHGDAFYRALGFSTEPRFDQATHWLALG